jgi:hypothetical protein
MQDRSQYGPEGGHLIYEGDGSVRSDKPAHLRFLSDDADIEQNTGYDWRSLARPNVQYEGGGGRRAPAWSTAARLTKLGRESSTPVVAAAKTAAADAWNRVRTLEIGQVSQTLASIKQARQEEIALQKKEFVEEQLQLSSWYRCICCIRHTKEIYTRDFEALGADVELDDLQAQDAHQHAHEPAEHLGTDSGSFEESARGFKGIDILKDTYSKMQHYKDAMFAENIKRRRLNDIGFAENFYMELNMLSLNSFYQRAQRDLLEFLAYFRINRRTEKIFFG